VIRSFCGGSEAFPLWVRKFSTRKKTFPDRGEGVEEENAAADQSLVGSEAKRRMASERLGEKSEGLEGDLLRSGKDKISEPPLSYSKALAKGTKPARTEGNGDVEWEEGGNRTEEELVYGLDDLRLREEESSGLEKLPPSPGVVEDAGGVTELRLVISNNRAGAIIGRQGATIQSIREATGATVKVSDRFGYMDRQVTITGQPEQVQHAANVIQTKLREAEVNATLIHSAHQQAMKSINVNNTEGFQQEKKEEVHDDFGNGPVELEVKMLVPNSKVGGLIGRKGAAINSIREKSGCTLKITREEDMPPGSTDRIVAISGAQARIELAQQLIIMRLNEINPLSSKPWNPRQQHEIPNEQQHVEEPNPYEFDHTYQNPYRQQATPGFGSEFPFQHSFPQASQLVAEENVSIPSKCVGKVIGRNGQTINEIRWQSKAKISIHPEVENSPIRIITLIGTTEAREAAKYLISSKLY